MVKGESDFSKIKIVLGIIMPILIIMGAAIFNFLPLTPPTSAGISSGLIAWYHLDGNANDASGNSNNGKMIGNVNCNINGKNGKACLFDGYSSISINSRAMPEDEYTISGWIRSDENAIVEVWRNWIIKPLDGTYRETTPFELYLGDGRQEGGKNGPNFIIWDQSTSVVNIGNSSLNVRDGKWHQMAITYKPGEQILYFDGEIVAKDSYRGKLPQTDSNILIGGANLGAYHKPWVGGIDEFRIYNRALLSSEIKEIYDLENK